MSNQNIVDYEIAHRIANENQLLGEERWLVDALKKVQTQRNSLQIERLHLESLKSQLIYSKTPETNENSESKETSEELPPVNLMQPIPSINTVDSYGVVIRDDEVCNGEELNLSVRSHGLQTEKYMEMEEYEEEDMDDDDYNIDMNMFMNGDHISNADDK